MSIVDFIVIGRGLIGSAVARHLAVQGASVVLVGPSEPASLKTHTGVFGSHYDSARIVRILDTLAHNCQISAAAIERFEPLENETGIKFFNEVGYLAASNTSNFLEDMSAQAESYYPGVEALSSEQLQERFPYFQFPKDVRGIFQAKDAGWLDPRKNIKAQNKALESNNGIVVDDTVVSIEKNKDYIMVKTNNSSLKCRKCIISTGAFANIGNTIPRPIDYGVVPHTAVLGEIPEGQLENLIGMPTLSYRLGDEPNKFLYFLPPVEYPNGKHYVKIGHALGDEMAKDKQSLQDWFHSNGDKGKIPWLTEALKELLPSITFNKFHSVPCVTTTSPSGGNYIDQFKDERLYALFAGGGYCAKSADELGYIATEFALNGGFPAPYNRADFKLIYQ